MEANALASCVFAVEEAEIVATYPIELGITLQIFAQKKLLELLEVSASSIWTRSNQASIGCNLILRIQSDHPVRE